MMTRDHEVPQPLDPSGIPADRPASDGEASSAAVMSVEGSPEAWTSAAAAGDRPVAAALTLNGSSGGDLAKATPDASRDTRDTGDTAAARAPDAHAGGQAGNQAASQAGALPIPERPALAPGVELKGEMSESAFLDPPWLIDRGGDFIMVPRLLYEVAAHASGERSHAELAAAVSEAVKRGVTAEHIALMVANLMKMGVIAVPDGINPVPQSDLTRARSLIALNLKMRMLSPRLIAPIAKVLQVLYWPPLLLVALATAVIAQGWLYLVHGIGDSFRHAVYTPGMMLLVLGIVIIATLFHEFGHAAALEYAGGRVRGMGVGLYIVYPAFYTDVTDNYRLPRWARVRTDLGGFYFNLVFAVGLMAIYALTGQEFLLLVVVILNLEIIYQLMPFIRLDGYWALADITGIPDFFSHIGPFLRSILPKWIPLPEGRKLPPLKRWGKLFYAGYLLVTVPLLLFLLYLTLRAMPRLLTTVYDASAQLIGQIPLALEAQDWTAAAAIVVQVVLLVLPVLGLSLLLLRIGRKSVTATWSWGARTPARRMATASASLAGIALVVSLVGPGFLDMFQPIEAGERFTIGEALDGRRRSASDEQPQSQQPQRQQSQSQQANDDPANTRGAEGSPLAPGESAPAGSPLPAPDMTGESPLPGSPEPSPSGMPAESLTAGSPHPMTSPSPTPAATAAPSSAASPPATPRPTQATPTPRSTPPPTTEPTPPPATQAPTPAPQPPATQAPTPAPQPPATPAPTAAAADPTPAAADPTPAVADPTPAVADPTPAVADPTPAVADPTPAVADPTPAVADPTPAVADPTPAAADPTPAGTPP